MNSTNTIVLVFVIIMAGVLAAHFINVENLAVEIILGLMAALLAGLHQEVHHLNHRKH